jgi:rare lipoprotein A
MFNKLMKSRGGRAPVVRWIAAGLAAASLAACAQAPAPTSQKVARAHKQYSPLAAREALAADGGASGVASYYSSGSVTASGERFDPNELTAAHRTLPFGTKLRVTNLQTGQSVTVRVNDRGPFVPGRVVDVSHGAANSLGLVGKGVAKVKLDVVE